MGKESRVPRLSAAKLVVALLAVLLTGATGAAARTVTLGRHGWQVQSSAQAPQAGARISQPHFATGSWLKVRPDDAGAVGTELNALVQNHRCPSVFFSTNLKTCFGYMSQV